MTRRRGALPWGACAGLLLCAGAAQAESSTPGGLRGLLRTRSADAAGHGVFEAGFFSSAHALDDSTGGTHYFSVTTLQMGYGISPFLELGAALPVRAWWTSGGTGAAPGVPDGQGGFGDLEAAAKLQLPLPGQTVRLGLLGEGQFPTGSRSRGFSTEATELGLGGAMTFDWSRMDRFPPVRLHVNGVYRWNRNELDGAGLAPLEDVRQGGFWPPAYPPSAPGSARRNDQLNWRAGIEFSNRVLTLFTEAALDDYLELDLPHWRQNPCVLTPGALVKFRNGFNLKGAVDISLQDANAPAAVPHLPDWRFTLGVTWRAELSLGDDDHDGVRNDRDLCPDRAEDLDGFNDEDGCPDQDNDEDGIPDARDLAPMLPEDLDGFQDEDGRPDQDNDGDGVRDADDRCPDDAEDYDGDRDGDGCPDGPAVEPEPEPRPDGNRSF